MTTMTGLRHGAVALASATMLVLPAAAAVAAPAAPDPSDPVLVPNPTESSDPGTSWTCRPTGASVTCTGALAYGWDVEPGPDDWCSVPLYSADGHFDRRQTRYYTLDPASGNYLETNRLVHLEITDALTAAPDDPDVARVGTVLRMTWASDFLTPGDLDSRVTRKQGIDTWFQPEHGGVFTLDVGQKTTVGSDDFDLRGRWDVATAGDPHLEFGKVCTSLGLD